jgi:Raf kinase inhibitor-like YbhB/YbcL family protein
MRNFNGYELFLLKKHASAYKKSPSILSFNRRNSSMNRCFNKQIVFLFLVSFLSVQPISGGDPMSTDTAQKFSISSPAFIYEEIIPVQYTGDGANISPPLSWQEAPENTKSFAIISDDPDAPGDTWVHWVVYNIPASVTSIGEAFPPKRKTENGTLQGINSFNRTGYGGPCPPSGTHRYYFKIYALDIVLNLNPGETTKETLQRAMRSHVIAQAEIMGKYKRKEK